MPDHWAQSRARATFGQTPWPGYWPKMPWIVPIPGMRKVYRLEENLGAAELELSAYELAEIEAAASKIQVQGCRYNEAAGRMTNL